MYRDGTCAGPWYFLTAFLSLVSPQLAQSMESQSDSVKQIDVIPSRDNGTRPILCSAHLPYALILIVRFAVLCCSIAGLHTMLRSAVLF